MQLSLKTDFGLRMLMALASTDEILSVDWIAEHHGLSRHHLAKVAQELNAAGYIETVRGRGGGLRLGRAPAEINIGQVVRDLENFEGFVACMGGANDCVLQRLCGLKPVLGGALQAFLAHLDGFTLADLDFDREAILARLRAKAA